MSHVGVMEESERGEGGRWGGGGGRRWGGGGGGEEQRGRWGGGGAGMGGGGGDVFAWISHESWSVRMRRVPLCYSIDAAHFCFSTLPRGFTCETRITRELCWEGSGS